MRRSLAAALLRSARGSSNSGIGSSSSEGVTAAAAASARTYSSGVGGIGRRPTLAASSESFSARGGTASCSDRTSATTSSWTGAPLFFCSRGIHTSSAASDSSKTPPRDYYDILGVPRGAPEAEVKRAFYRLAKQHHPDANAAGDNQAEAAKKFQEVNKAYDCLRDPQKRALYDQVGVEAFEGGVGSGGGGGGGGGAGGFGGGGFGGFGGGGNPFGGGFGGGGGSQQQQPDVEDIFAAFFGGLGGGGGGGARAGTRGGFSWTSSSGGQNPFAAAMMRSPDIHVSIRLPFDAAARGGRRTLNLAGLGGNRGDSRSVEIDVPAGIDTGAVLRVSGQGAPLPANAPKGATRGNLLVEVEVDPSPVFSRRSLMGKPEDVEFEAEVEFWDAALGGSVRVPTPLEGERELALRPGTQPGDRFRMKGYGLPRLSHSTRGSASQHRGDQYVRVGVRVPKSLSPRAAQLLRELAEEVKGVKAGKGGGGAKGSSSEGKAKAA